MSYSSNRDEGQVILSCSHVFHAQCFRSFERYVRAQQRADALGVTEVIAPLACPVCRTQSYYKRIFYEGKAVAQRAAIVKVQAAVRGLLARRAYTKIRLLNNPQFRTRYVQERLARLSAAWQTFCAEQEQRRAGLQTALAVQHEMARAAFLSEEAWAELWRKAVHGPSTSSEPGSLAPPSTACALVQCPICLELIHCSQCPGTGAAAFHAGGVHRLTGEDAVAEMRMAYEARKAAQSLPSVEPKASRASAGTLAGASAKGAAPRKAVNPLTPKPGADVSVRDGKVASRRAPQHRAGRRKGFAQSTGAAPWPENENAFAALSSAQGVDAVGADEAAVVLPHSGVLLSCGHYFHAACIDCYERFNERRSLEIIAQDGRAAVAFPNRCPICRSGYIKHPM
ncbi:conserved hypothetical protein [Leishmania infantum JPCM5]|uniref:Ring_finger_domain/IQ_calmodulin-binding_motif_containing_protein_-_putative n=4 Tax=Leishmania donovani species complex TaxID=38574 RepID=A0A6L0XRX8_LEIIN|nr:conserved hypothetical protein [Leishmania infantum JPCM5]XP_003864835.1 hypothetical protein, conserved [Leishmania donovani]CAC9544998.1 Ring_finger_domain/IQ_calmodulin-binding_motif_containing_protein_-_putative [Leishmania infantum]CAM72179.1 conserved hypothetical protein [Leishmania infantum JPCM5]CBZ38155.1 hypothetical protein, conserved [Leishmania donovani]SUZ46081.1 Ring_finger_domain/IQ_calmodulin-binding_motif_containing_protein_-_putative [Leishmania infantum]VDZ48892.1 Ring|eukprot:XP_001469080.1 conserved hypothetical protein [Leishmania infantum JPCM5]